ncbi:MAG: hypothetical protein RLZZ416_822 [Candidatus Parcubacteria bacterium]|jgi:hypothetical protein
MRSEKQKLGRGVDKRLLLASVQQTLADDEWLSVKEFSRRALSYCTGLKFGTIYAYATGLSREEKKRLHIRRNLRGGRYRPVASK